jgi:hypothetical protein
MATALIYGFEIEETRELACRREYADAGKKIKVAVRVDARPPFSALFVASFRYFGIDQRRRQLPCQKDVR